MSQRSQDIFKYIRDHLPVDQCIIHPIVDSEQLIIGFHCHLTLVGGDVIASGTHRNLNTARQIAIAETIERIAVINLDEESIFRTHFRKVPSTSGFAAGFELRATKLRAICEGVERWAWSQWIDNGHHIPKEDIKQVRYNALAAHLSKCFDDIAFYKLKIRLEEQNLSLDFGMVLAFKAGGVFAGSRVNLADHDVLTHSLIEAHRNFTNFQLIQNQTLREDDWFMKRVKFFGLNAEDALTAIERAKNDSWPEPRIDVFCDVAIPQNLFHLWRCLIKDFVPWHEGPIDRFVY